MRQERFDPKSAQATERLEARFNHSNESGLKKSRFRQVDD